MTDTHKKRPPIVVVMGHIDHGKSTLLDTIRSTDVVGGEAGSITQHLSAYSVTHHSEEHGDYGLTFLDTPGHAAFQQMRLRGADVADIAILIVSAEDGVKPQTLEALAAIKEAGIPYVVAINKIDKPNADLTRTQTSLIENEIFIEGMGGDTPWAAISAKAGTGIDELLDTVILSAEFAELSGDPEASAEGMVIEGHLDARRGTAATLIITNGTLKSGTFVVSENVYAPVRIMEDCHGKSIKEAGLSDPVGVVGWSGTPRAGAHFTVVKNKKEAEVAVRAWNEALEKPSSEIPHRGAHKKPVIPILIKTDVLGTIDAVKHEIEALKNDRVELRVVDATVGSIEATDVQTISATENAIIIGFNVSIERAAKELAERREVAIGSFSIIYELVQWLDDRIKERTPVHKEEVITGVAKILRIFSTQKNVHVAGGRVDEGTLSVGQQVRITRRDVPIGTGKIVNMQAQKTNVDRVSEGEFGMQLETRTEFAEGDRIKAFEVRVV